MLPNSGSSSQETSECQYSPAMRLELASAWIGRISGCPSRPGARARALERPPPGRAPPCPSGKVVPRPVLAVFDGPLRLTSGYAVKNAQTDRQPIWNLKILEKWSDQFC